jgi:hypothetical protein
METERDLKKEILEVDILIEKKQKLLNETMENEKEEFEHHLVVIELHCMKNEREYCRDV